MINIYVNIGIILAFLFLGIWYLYKLNKNFSMRLFYQLGFWAFMIIAIANFFKFYIAWPYLGYFDVAISCSGIFINLLFASLFGYFAKQEFNKESVEMEKLTNKEMEKMFKDG